MRKLQIIMHTHWDREWYFSKDETNVWLRHHMIEVITFLKENQDIIYILDGQSIMIDDFLRFSPEYKQDLDQLIKNKQLRVGPWYTQTDLLIVNGESIVRNLYYGIKTALKFGDPMLIGYAPDTFGHNSQMPQIYSLFNINSSFFWRGFNEDRARKCDFTWQGLDGTNIIGVNLATGYQGAKYLESTPSELKTRLDKLLKTLDKFSTSSGRLIMNGHDQMPIQTNIQTIIKQLKCLHPNDEVKISDFETYLAELKREKLTTVIGELNECQHARIHKTITSTRNDLKLLNAEIEHLIYKQLEPLAVIASYINIPYPHYMLDQLFKELFQVHAHDSIGGCNSDAVNQDIWQRLTNIRNSITTYIEITQRIISSSVQTKYGKNIITVYNYLPATRSNESCYLEVVTPTANFTIFDENKETVPYKLIKQERIDAGLIDRQIAARLLDTKAYKSEICLPIAKINGLTVKYFTVEYNFSQSLISPSVSSKTTIENDYYTIYIKGNTLYLLDKVANKTYKDIFFLENSGDAGDSYDYSPPESDRLYTSQKNGVISILPVATVNEELNFNLTMKAPLNLAERNGNKQTTAASFNVHLKLNGRLIELQLNYTNKCSDTRFRIGFNSAIMTNIVTSDTQFGTITRPTYWTEKINAFHNGNWSEKPIAVETFQSYVHLTSPAKSNHTFTVFSHGLKEYEVINEQIYITLFRSVSHLGKRNLINRPGRPSGMEIPSPHQQMLGTTFSFSLAFALNETKPYKLAQIFLNPLKGYQRKDYNRFNMNLPVQKNLIAKKYNLNMKDLVVTACKLTVKNQLFIRAFNPTSEIQTLTVPHAFLANALEEKLQPQACFSVAPQKIIQFIIMED